MVNMKILDLPLKAKWYEMIESGNKKEEYREIKKYWIGRLAKCGGRNSYFDKALRIITLNRCTIGERGGNIHRCQKPVKLYAEILRKNAKEGDKIFDSHLGSGSSRIAAYGLGFDFYATEIDEEYFEAQEERFHRECFGEIKTERGRLVQTNLFDK